MLLVITPSAKARGCAQAIQQVTSEETHVAATSSQALARLRAQEYGAVLIDQAFLETEPVESDMVLESIGTAVPVHVNFAINNMDRVARELRAALLRHKKQVQLVRQEVQHALRNELKGTVTALLLSCELALHVPESPERSRKQDAQRPPACPGNTPQARKPRLRPSGGAPLRPQPRSAIFCAPARFPRKSFPDIAVPALQ